MTLITSLGSAIANIVTDTTHELCDWTTAVPTNASAQYATLTGVAIAGVSGTANAGTLSSVWLVMNDAQSAEVIGVVSGTINTLALSAVNALVSAAVLSKTGYY